MAHSLYNNARMQQHKKIVWRKAASDSAGRGCCFESGKNGDTLLMVIRGSPFLITIDCSAALGARLSLDGDQKLDGLLPGCEPTTLIRVEICLVMLSTRSC